MRPSRHVLAALAIDLLLITLAWWLAFWLRFNLDVPEEFADLAARAGGWSVAAFAVGLATSKVYRQIWRYSGMAELGQLVTGVAAGALLSAISILMLRYPNFPRSVLLLQPLIVLLLLGAVRAGWRTLTERSSLPQGATPLLIVGTLSEAADAMRALKTSTAWYPVAIMSPDYHDHGRSLQNVPVFGGSRTLDQIVKETEVKTALIAGAPGSPQRREALLQSAMAPGVRLLTMPRPDDWLRSDRGGPREAELEDLLGRAPVELDSRGLSELLGGQTALVTGAGGSIGAELCRQIARYGPSTLVCVDCSEFAIYRLEQELRSSHPKLRVHYYTANVREASRLNAIASEYKPRAVFHAAANKHVPLMEEYNEIEALRTNILGTMNCAEAAGICGALRFVFISTDKAVNPTNVMGATKRLAELMVQGIAARFPRTQFVSVRFGNVLGSSGSVVPLFNNQIARGGPVTVTHPDIVRYFMTIPEAVQLVLQAGLMGDSKEIFVLDMGEPVKIAELARLMIFLSGKSELDIPIVYTGLRPGEKLFEELLASDESTAPTAHPKLRISKSFRTDEINVGTVRNWIENCGASPSGVDIREWLRLHVPEYAPRS
ncbi:nucleoside-diphosphate sugar epimerase/dehydratase [Variovorax robiniae]|uniref:Nucleoside-diphosphate sugar epimerase/dehydratase n=1 Tax=Variovorax robiniae TaxID=1836199 RepID=A0ABU8XES4_9BURK